MNFFRQNIVHIRSNLLDLNSPETGSMEQEACLTTCFSEFVTLEESEVSRLISSSNLKSCALDLLPACLVSGPIDVLLPSITKMINLSLMSGHFPAEWKMALVLPLLNKRGLDPILKNYRPISNLQFVSKLVKRSVFNQLHEHLLSNNLYPIFQSAHRAYHSTETALLKVQNDPLLNMDRGYVTLLVLLDLSSAFDTIDRSILLSRLQHKFEFDGLALSWFKSYLTRRSFIVLVNNVLSNTFDQEWVVPQGSCLGPLLFVLCFSQLFEITGCYLPDVHVYANDTQLYISFSPNDIEEQLNILSAIEDCAAAIRSWMSEDKLKLNDDKTEFLLVGTKQQLAKVCIKDIKVGCVEISLSSSVRNLGVWFDSSLNMSEHITKLCPPAFFYIYNVRRIRKYLSRDSAETLAYAFISSRLDYGNSLLFGLPQYQIQKLQQVQNASPRLIFSMPTYCHITPLLFDLHFLPVNQRIVFKILLLVYEVLHQLAPSYLVDLISVMPCSSYNLRRNNNGVLLRHPPAHSKKTLGDRFFSHAIPKLWSNLPFEIRCSNSIVSFKSQLKTFLLKKVFH